MKDFWFLLEDFYFEDFLKYFCMVKYLNFHIYNSSFALRYFLKF